MTGKIMNANYTFMSGIWLKDSTTKSCDKGPVDICPCNIWDNLPFTFKCHPCMFPFKLILLDYHPLKHFYD